MSVASEIYDAIVASIGTAMVPGALYTILTGGAWKRPLVRTGPGSTPEAFDSSGRVKPAAVVPDRGEVGDGFGPRLAFLGAPEVWCYAPATDAGKTAIDAAFAIIRPLLDGATVDGIAGTGTGLRIVGRLGIGDDPVIAGAVVDVLRFQADGLWGNPS